MPVTPFHLGPGALIKAIVPRQVSLTTFALANGLIDLEPILHFLLTGDPAHRLLHTLPGATIAALVAVWPGRSVGEAWLRFWNSRLSAPQARWLGCSPDIGLRPALVGALLGAWSHLGLDMAMHVDVRPLWPLSEQNPWHGWLSVDGLHIVCIASGLAAMAVWLGLRACRHEPHR
jgi:membrane-bound metal-dependent hydrolase YbcI (DUF457 family)